MDVSVRRYVCHWQKLEMGIHLQEFTQSERLTGNVYVMKRSINNRASVFTHQTFPYVEFKPNPGQKLFMCKRNITQLMKAVSLSLTELF